MRAWGAAREVTFSCLAEPTALLCLLVLAKFAEEPSLNALLGPQLPALWHGTAGVSLIMVMVCLFVVLLAEKLAHPL